MLHKAIITRTSRCNLHFIPVFGSGSMNGFKLRKQKDEISHTNGQNNHCANLSTKTIGNTFELPSPISATHIYKEAASWLK